MAHRLQLVTIELSLGGLMVGACAHARIFYLVPLSAGLLRLPYGRPCCQHNGADQWPLSKPAHHGRTLQDSCRYAFVSGRAIGRRSLAIHPVIHSLSLSCRLAALFSGALLAIVAASLAVEDQRRFLSCRASGSSVDACLLQINGR